MQWQCEHVTGFCPIKSELRCFEFGVADRQSRFRKSESQQFCADDARYFAGRSTPQMRLIFLDDHEVRIEAGGGARQFCDIGILAVTGMAEEETQPAAAAAQAIGHR